MRLFLPVAISIASYGVVWGVLAGQAGLTPLEVLLMSGLVFAGSSQFVAVDMWTPASLPIVSIIVATAIINLRMVLMSATLRPQFAGVPRWRALLAMFLVSDEVWAMTIDDPTAYGLDFAFTATFLALLLSMWKGRGDLVPWLAGGAIAIGVAAAVPGTWYIIAGGLGGSFIGALLQHWRTRDAH